MVFGKLLFGFILGNIASTLANAEIRRVKFEEKLGAIQVGHVELLNILKVPRSISKILVMSLNHNRRGVLSVFMLLFCLLSG